LAGESDKVVAALTLEALRRYQIDRPLGISWLIGFERDCKKLEFVLELSDALAQLPEQTKPDILEFMASTFMMPLEKRGLAKFLACSAGSAHSNTLNGARSIPAKISIGPITVPVAMSITSFAAVVVIHFR
jgi:hypothetical protein